eukprot:GEMP01083381.1.p1 GENE.GEMP01083381.1~~GEMP01083381.1.p1  ORF type:complete len:276 (-),score=19.16 GEMP01083381.1:199-975(-)
MNAIPCSTKAKLDIRVDAKILHQFWLNSIQFMDTAYGRDRSCRFFQYLGRFLHGLVPIDAFQTLSSVMALSRKPLRFFGPLKAIKALCDLVDDTRVGAIEKGLTFAAVMSDGLYRLMDHIAFLERLKFISLSPINSDRLDRFVEIFWLTEVIPMICREARAYFYLRVEEKTLPAEALNELKRIAERKRKVLLSLFKVLICDLPCVIFVMNPMDFKQKRIHKVISSAVCAGSVRIPSLATRLQFWTRRTCCNSPRLSVQ